MDDFNNQSLLIIDDDDSVVKTMQRFFSRMDIKVQTASCLRDGLEKIEHNDFDVVFLDVNLPDGNGIEQIGRILDRKIPPQIIIMTAYPDQDGAALAIENGVWDYLEKPVSSKNILLQLKRALEFQAQKRQIAEIAKFEAPGIISRCRSMQACLDQAAQIAASDANVIITGETGTGKELFARAIHENSARRNGSFIVVDCSVLTENLIESALFGHERGAFTSADKRRQGLISLAHGGTLFLDEVGELPPSMQSSFLRVLEEKRFRPIGSGQEIHSDFRVICATNRNLEQMAADGLFRTDLLYRLKSFVLKLPALRDRKEDILPIAENQIRTSCEMQTLPVKDLTPDFIDTLLKYDWPGNVRELINTVRACVAQAQFEKTLFAFHLPHGIRAKVIRRAIEKTHPPVEAAVAGSLPDVESLTYKAFMDKAETAYLQALYSRFNGDIQTLVKQSGISRAALYKKLKQCRIK